MPTPQSHGGDPPVAEIVYDVETSQSGQNGQNGNNLSSGNSSSTSSSCLFWFLAIGGTLSLALIAFCYLTYRALAPQNVVDADEARQRLDDRYELAATAFSGDELLAENDSQELKEIRLFLSEVSQITDFTIKPELGKIIDFQRYAHAMREEESLGTIAFFGDNFCSILAAEQVVGPMPFTQSQIYQVDDLGDNERLVYAHVSGDYGDDTPFLYWIIKKNGRWKLFDWENLRYGIKDAEETAVTLGDNNSEAQILTLTSHSTTTIRQSTRILKTPNSKSGRS